MVMVYVSDLKRLVEDFKAYFEKKAYTKVILQVFVPKDVRKGYLGKRRERPTFEYIRRGERSS